MCHVTDKARHQQRTPTGGKAKLSFFHQTNLVPGASWSLFFCGYSSCEKPRQSAQIAPTPRNSQAKNRLAVGLFLLYQIHQYNLGYVASDTVLILRFRCLILFPRLRVSGLSYHQTSVLYWGRCLRLERLSFSHAIGVFVGCANTKISRPRVNINIATTSSTR